MADDLQQNESASPALELHPSLAEVVAKEGLNSKRLTVGLKMQGNKLDLSARDEIAVTDGSKGALWKVPSLRALFRGSRNPPSMSGTPPEEYIALFNFVESHVLTFCDAFGDKTDGEFEEAYSNLRRRPDGKSFSDLHFYLWQVAAGLVGNWDISAAEFEAIFGRLTISAATFRMGLVSRNYTDVLRGGLGALG